MNISFLQSQEQLIRHLTCNNERDWDQVVYTAQAVTNVGAACGWMCENLACAYRFLHLDEQGTPMLGLVVVQRIPTHPEAMLDRQHLADLTTGSCPIALLFV